MLRNVLLAFGILLTGLHASQVTAQTSCETCDLSFVAETLETLEISCSEGDPLQAVPPFPAFNNTCTQGYWASTFKYTTGSAESCSGVRPVGLPSNLGTIQLGEFSSTGLTPSNHFNDLGSPLTWTVYPENVARLQGTVFNISNINASLEVDFYYELNGSGAEWTASGGNVNDAAANDDVVDGWTIWNLRPNISKLVGGGDLEGQIIYLKSSNSLLGYPLQVGAGANGVNAEQGLGGAFDWSACVNGTIYGGLGVSTLEFTSCAETSSICASDNDAVVEFFVGNLQGFDQIQGAVDVTDDTAPLLQDLPNDYTLNCPVELEELDALTTVFATDDCSTASLTMTETFINGDCPSEFTRIRTFTATDGCGLTSQHTQTVEVIDVVDPVLNVPSNAVFSCDVGPTFAPATATDACNGSLTVVEGEQVTEPGDCPGEYTIHRTFSTEDLCGNTATGAQTIYVQDLTPPTIALPADVILPCGSEFVYPPASVTDNCTAEEDITLTTFNSLPPTDCPQERILERRFLATDLCGNSTLEIQTVTVTDNDLPFFTYVPADTSFSCDEEPMLEDAVATDDCSSFEITTTTDTLFGECASNYDLIRTFTVIDACGNMADAQQVISIRDTEAPVIGSVFDEVLSIECDQIWSPTDLDAQDNCSAVSWELSIDTVGTPSTGVYQLNVIHTAVDACGNAASTPQTVSVSDTTPPAFVSVPEDLTLSCEDDIPFEVAVATDNCTAVTVEVSDDLALEVALGEHLLTRTFTATDAQGNIAQAVQLISIVDATAPQFTFVPADYTIECSEDLTLLDATAQDNCSDVSISVSSVTTPGGATGNYTLTRTFTATDDAGNSTSASQTITVQDTTAPEFTTVPADYTVECTDDMPMEAATAIDACGPVTVEVSSITTQGNASGNYVITRTFNATDDAGNSTSASQTITVQDTTAPEFTFVPADYTVECSEEMPMDDATASDNCAVVSIEVESETTPGNATGNYVITRTFTATDDAGNSTSTSQTITVVDTTAPILNVPADYTVECSDEMPMDDATASDNCGEVTIEVTSETAAGDAAGNYVITRTFTATDDAGNSTSASQTITVQDTTAPEFTFVPADYTVECSEEMPMDDAVAADNCGEVTVEVSNETTPGNATGNYVITRTFTATDDAGNSTSTSQTITVVDTTAPILNVPADYTTECSDGLVLDLAEAFDLCGPTSVAVEVETILGDAIGNYTLIRTFTATDDAGNSTSASQTITVQDTTPPEFISVPEDAVVECSEDLPYSEPSTNDACGTVELTYSDEVIPGNAAGNYTVIRTFTATDDAGNSSSATQTFNVVDTTDPEFTFVPADFTVECSDEMPMDDATASDNCGEVTMEVTSETAAGDAAGNYVITRTFTATDDAGNSTSAEQTITVQDTTAPEFTFVPADYTVECSEEMPMDVATASDNCGEVTIEVESETTSGNATGNYVITRTFTATDDAGNSTSTSQTITVVDTTAPILNVPADYTAECSDEMPMDDATASDNCGEVSIEVTSQTTAGDAAGNYVITRTFTATDDAGNATSATQTITVQDTTSPEFTFVPADYVVECSDVMPMDDATAADNCGEVTIEVTGEIVAGDAAGDYVIVRTFTATDDAGNSSSATQTITVQDTTAPEFTFVPADYTVECSDEMPMEDATASDNCGEVTMEVTSEVAAGDAAGNYVITRTFTATDDAGNSSIAAQTITVQDTTAPEFTFVPADYTVECSDEILMDDALAADNCGEVTVEVSNETTPGNATGNYVITRTFTASDDAGNSSSATQTITVQDTSAPEFSFVPADAIVECTDAWPEDMALASDACGPVDIQVTTDTLPGFCGLLRLERTFTATDDAGNVNTVVQTLTQVDTQGPVFVDLVEEVDLSCSQNFTQIPIPGTTDACSEVTTLVWTDESFSGGCTLPISAILRTYTAVDACNNVSQAEQIILLTDNEAPEWDFLPEDVTIECTDVYELVPPTATDNCATPQIIWEVDTVGDVSTGVYDLVFAFQAVDDCDNIAEHEHVVHVEDTVSPEWVTFPEDYTMACGEALDTTMPTAADACSDMVTVNLVDEFFSEGECLGSGLWTRTFSATDANGNVLESSQLIQVVDTVAPYFTAVPEAVTVECDEALPSVLAEAEDACGTTTVSVSESVVDGSNANNYTVIRTFTATDACGNETDTTQIVNVVDTTPPTFLTTWSDETRQCGEDLSPLPVEAVDACSDSVFVTTNDVMTPGLCEGAITLARTYIISDFSGNADSMLVTVNVVDTIAPVWVTTPENLTVSCDEALPTDEPLAEDVCSEVTLVLATDTVLGNALGNYEVIQTWTAEDACGNNTMHERVIQVVDTIAPEVVFPENDTVACNAEVPLTEPVILDNCGTTSWTYVDETTPGPCEGASTLTRTFTVTDDAGNLVEGVQVISIVDEEAPEFTFVPEPTTWECNAPTLLDSAVATDACSDVTLTAQLDTLSGLGANQWTLLVTWMAQDGCGNTAEATQEITVLDQLAPTIDVGPAGTSLAWGDSLLLDVWESELVYMDSCTQNDDLVVSVQIDTLEALEPCIEEVVLTWSVQDLAGNEENWIQPVQLFDNDAPVWLEEPADLLLPCDSVWEPVAPAWTDHNDFEVTQTLDTLPGACPAEMTLTWTLLASDVCGNVSEPWIQVVNFVDSLAPDLVSWPEDVVVNAPADVPVCNAEGIVWTDNCSDALVDCVTDTLEQYCPGSYLLGRTYSVTDACGNASSVQQNILVEDVEAPVFTNWVSAETFSCDSTVVAPGAADLSFEDNQSNASDIALSSVLSEVLGDECALTEVYTYTLTDGCGNVSEDYVMELSFVDDEAPVLQEALETLELFCVSEIPAFDEAALLENVTDNCGSVTAVASDEFEGGECNGPDCVLIRTITMVDNCGNTASAEQIMVISEPPTVPELPTGFSPNNDSFNDVYQVRNAGPDLGIPPCDWLENTTFTVFDRWGSVVFLSNDISESWDGTNLNGRPLPVGTYFVVFEANGLTYRQTVDLRR
ncbi:MAG: hypothetical protein CMC99_04825 [Flavobacteriales bacterium]|nr:hypothetical protein [Flavobacteriales bacterium]